MNYVVLTPYQLKDKRICHINMIKIYIESNNNDLNIKPISTLTNIIKNTECYQDGNKDIFNSEEDREYSLH